MTARYPITEPIIISINAMEIITRFARIVDNNAARNQNAAIR